MPDQRPLMVTLCLVLAASISCARSAGPVVATSASEMPPLDLLQGNFATAPYVLEIEVRGVSAVVEFRSDSGDVGYVQYSVIGTIIDILKSSEEREFLSNEVVYRFTQESDETTTPAVMNGGRYLVFLMEADDPPQLWLIGNGSQFELSPQLSETMRTIAVR